MNKRTKIIGGLLIFVIFIAIGIIIASREEQQDVPQRKLSGPIIPNQYKGDLPLQSSIDEKEFNFPKKAPLLSFSFSEISKEESQKIADKLGFSGEPLSVNDFREGVKYIWSNETFFLVVTPKTATLKYGLNNLIPTVTDEKLGDESLANIAIDFLSQAGLASKDDIKSSTVTFLKESLQGEGFQETDRESTEVFQINFVYNVSDFDILTLNSSEPLIFVQIQRDGSIFKAQVTRLKDILKTEDQYALKNYEDVQNSLDQAVLMDLINAYISIPDLSKTDIENIDLEEVKLAYLFESPQTKTLQPIYVLKGRVKISGYQDDIEAILYMPALKNP